MKVEPTRFPGVIVIEPAVYRDHRGHFLETWNQDRYTAAGLPLRFVQDNLSISKRGVLRGLHYQHPNGQGKLVSAAAGTIFDVVVDIRRGSPTFGEWFGLELSAANGRQLYIPPGFAHGFLVLSDEAVFLYKCTEYYRPANEGCVLWSDPDLGIAWPSLDGDPVVSPKDAAAPRLRDLPEAQLPVHGEPGAGG
jgi:dTDP-4-dehydrorhamnose 3,5-epimerase